MKILKLHLPLFFALAIAAFSCAEDDSEIIQRVDRLFRQSMKEVANKTCLSVNIKKEAKDQYFIDAVMADSSRFQAIATGSTEKDMKIVETLNSTTARFVQDNVGVICTDLVLTKVKDDSVLYEGTATLLGGEVLKIRVNPEMGWFPENDMESMATIMKYQLKKANAFKDINIAMKQESEFEYMATVKADAFPPYDLKVVHLGTEFRYDKPENISTFRKDSTATQQPTTPPLTNPIK
jgi:hypothetical protein